MLATALLAFCLVLQAPDPPGACEVAAEPVAAPVLVDGRLDDASWSDAPVATGFRQVQPDDGAPATQETRVRILYGDDALYVGAELADDEPDAIRPTLGRRDEFNQADWFTVFVDSYLDRKTAYTFAVNAAGVQVDGITSQGTDHSWDAVWESAVTVHEAGWTVEMRIPYAMLRYAEADVQTWGVNFRRFIPRRDELADWAYVPREERGSAYVAGFGQLSGLAGLRPVRNVQVTPYALARADALRDGEAFDASGEANAGADLKVGLSSNLTLDATINPDFGQVDADPAVLNLSAFETFFPERRPFFVEGADIFDFDAGNGARLLYTRRIGQTAPIIGALKLTGRSERGLSMGALGAATGEAFQPERGFAALRLRQEIGRHSSLGAMATAVHRAGGQALAGGADWDVRLADNRYSIAGAATLTHRSADASTGVGAFARAGRIQGTLTYGLNASVYTPRYNPNDLGSNRRNNFYRFGSGVEYAMGERGPFQRGHFSLWSGQSFTVDEGLSTGFGFFGFARLVLPSTAAFGMRGHTDYLFGGYDVFETRGLGPWKAPRPLGIWFFFDTDARRSWQLEPGVGLRFTDDGGRSLATEIEIEWRATDRLALEVEIGMERADDVTAWAANDAYVRTPGGWQIGTDGLAPDETEAFVAFDDGGLLDRVTPALAPYDDAGRFYLPVFGARDTRQMDLSLRSSLTLSPTFSLQLYAQAFAARGRFTDLALLTAPDVLAEFDAYPRRRDFARRSLQTNMVMRWEYRPGSTLFVVWSQAGGGSVDYDDFDLTEASPFSRGTGRQFGELFGEWPDNALVVKLSYLFL